MSSNEQAAEFFDDGKYEEALPLYRVIVESDPTDLDAWQSLIICLRNTQSFEAGVETAKAALKAHPRSAWNWRELGQMLIKLDRLDEAHKTLDQAKRIEPGSEWLWRYYAQLYKKQKKYTEEANALEELVELDLATSQDVNRIGIAYYNGNNYGKALAFYRMSAEMEPGIASFFNMGLLYSDPEVSQDADATDAYRRALEIDPDYAKAQNKLASTKAKLKPLAEGALSQADEVIRREERFQYYLNPFEVLQLDTELEDLDPKTVQRSKKILLQELDLNDGKVSWLDDQPLDRSRALIIDEELDNADKQEYHRLIAETEPLLRFLTHGDIRHFLYSEDYFPEEALDLLDEDDGFRSFLSRPFATQYNAVLSRAIDKKMLAVVEILFDGRRWVEDADLDLCLNGAFKKAGHLVDVMTELENESVDRLVGFPEVQNALDVHGIVGLFNLLPAQFRGQQTQMVACLRTLAINCHNKHGETEMSKNILLLCKQFQFKSHALNERLKEDYEKIEELLAEQIEAKPYRAPKPSIPRAAPSSSTPRTTPAQSVAQKQDADHIGRFGRWVALVAILCVGGLVCNRLTPSKEVVDRSPASANEYPDPEPQANRPSGEIHFPKEPPPPIVSVQEPWKPPPDARVVQTKPAQPVVDDSWEAVSYSNGEAPECFNYSPRYDRELDNQLRVKVGGGTDVVIKLMQRGTDRCIRYVYITSRSTYAIRNIPEGLYYLKIAYGKRWVEKKEAGMCMGKFASSPLYEKGEDILDFNTRSTGTTYENGRQYENYEIPSFEIQLDVVTTGFSSNSLNTDGISEAEFNK
jgi:tetratricopeptide (TPR) repeat protein